MSPSDFTRALVRRPSPCYAAAYLRHGITISDALMQRQHDAYIAALAQAGLEVTTLPPHATHYDCVFIEDTAIVVGKRALITRVNDRRRGEEIDVAAWLSEHGFAIEHVPESARIEGGDVLHLEDVTLVGRSARTNDAGIEILRRFMHHAAHEVIAVPVERCLHLKSAMTSLGDGAVLVSPALIDVDLPQGYRRIDVASSEPNAGNVLRIGRKLIYARAFPQTALLLQSFAEAHGLTMTGVDISQAQLGDGALTCQSLLW
jgi:dimethylargininase